MSNGSLLKTKTSSEGSGSVESGDELTSRVKTDGKKATGVRKIPIYGADGSKVSEVELDEEVYDYLSFATDVVAAQPGFNGIARDRTVHVMWPWDGYIVNYRGAAEQPLDPLMVRWSDFISRLRKIIVEPEVNIGVTIPLHLDGHSVSTTRVTSNIRMRYCSNLSSFLTAIRHSFVSWWKSQSGGERLELKGVATKNNIVSYKCRITFFDRDGEEMPDIWSIELPDDGEDENGEEEDAEDDDEEEEGEADVIADEGVGDAEVIDGEGEDGDEEGFDGVFEEVFDGGFEEVDQDQFPIDFQAYIGRLGSVTIKHSVE